MASRSEERFDREEVGELIGLASRLEAVQGEGPETGLTFDQLRRVAEEFGISEQALREVIRDRDRGLRAGMKQAKRLVARRLRFIRHLTVYLVVVGALFLVDWLNGGGWWFYYVAALWGILLALHGLRFVTRKRGPLERYLLRREAPG